MKRFRFSSLMLVVGLLFIYLPMLILVIYSFNASKLVTVWGGWSIKWYVGLLDNTKEQADVILATLAEALRERHGVARVVIRRKEHYSKPATGALIDEMAKEVQVAVAAVGG